MKKSLVLALVLCGVANANTLEEAFKNGKTSGDISAYYEARRVNSGQKSVYYNDTSWAVGSVGLNYQTDDFRNFKFGVGFRGAVPFYEKDKNYDTGHGKGDSTERFYEHNRAVVSNLYLQYNAYDTLIKVGRQNMSFDWVSKINDGVSIINNSFANLTLDAFYTKSRGKAQVNEMIKIKKINENRGLFGAGAGYKFDSGFGIRAYAMYADELFFGSGAKISYDKILSDNLSFGGFLHYAKSSEKKLDDGLAFEALSYVKFSDIKLSLGYAQSGKKNGWGSFNIAGDKIVQFEEGDVMYERDAKTYYAMVSTKIQNLDISAIYGATSYKIKGGDNTKYTQDEVSLWLNYPILKDLSVFATFDKTFKAQPYYPSLTQLSLGLSYSF